MPEVAGDAALLVDPLDVEAIRDGILPRSHRRVARRLTCGDAGLARAAAIHLGSGRGELCFRPIGLWPRRPDRQLRRISPPTAARHQIGIMTQTTIHLQVNGSIREVQVTGKTMLLDVLREDLGLTGTKNGCGQGHCGACTVIVNGKAVRSCITRAARLDGATSRPSRAWLRATVSIPSKTPSSKKARSSAASARPA